MIGFLLIRVIILLISALLCDTTRYVCDKNVVPCGCGQSTAEVNTRIVNGENSIPNSWPMIVSLRNEKRPSVHSCGGTILTESYILTAAHCVDEFSYIENVTIAAGVYNLSQPDQIMRRVDRVIIHPLWKEFHSTLQYDIAILHLVEPLDLTKNSSLTRTCLPPRASTSEEMMQYPLNGTSLVVIGWGAIETFGFSPDILQQVTLHSMYHFDIACANTIRDPAIQFCAGFYQDQKGPCYGDSGGPIFQWIGDRWQQVGLVSYGENGCGAKGYPGVFTRLSYFHDWIESHIHNNNQTNTFDNTTINHRVLYPCYKTVDQCGCGRQNVVLSPSTVVTSENALPHTWSMIVSIRAGPSQQYICSGTILDDFYVLTTAHCLAKRSAQDITIEAGMYRRSENGPRINQVNRIYIHPNYTTHSNVLLNDIAILQLTSSLYIDHDTYISKTCLSPVNDQWMNTVKYPSNGTRLVISGWDIPNASNASRSEILQQTEVSIIEAGNSHCFLSNDQRSLQFCAGRHQIGSEICSGDVFGEPIFRWIDSHWVQVGLGSYCGTAGQVGIFTSLATYSSWIESILNSTIETTSNTYQCDKKAPCGCGQTDVNLTVFGSVGVENAIEHSWPMIVSIQYHDTHQCGGTILSDSFILTSASCLTNLYSRFNLTVVAGSGKLHGSVTVRRQIDQIYIHENLSSVQPDLHNIAIVHLDQPLPLADTPSILTKTCAPDQSESLTSDYPKPNSPLVVISWDFVSLGDKISSVMQQISARTVSNEHQLCSNFVINKTYQFCASLLSDTKSQSATYLCNGDAGGPVLAFKNNHWEQVGIIPYKLSCRFISRVGVYTRLSPYLAWIKNITNYSMTVYPSPINNSGISNQRYNSFILEILFLLIILIT